MRCKGVRYEKEFRCKALHLSTARVHHRHLRRGRHSRRHERGVGRAERGEQDRNVPEQRAQDGAEHSAARSVHGEHGDGEVCDGVRLCGHSVRQRRARQTRESGIPHGEERSRRRADHRGTAHGAGVQADLVRSRNVQARRRDRQRERGRKRAERERKDRSGEAPSHHFRPRERGVYRAGREGRERIPRRAEAALTQADKTAKRRYKVFIWLKR